jgi:drug/metabolite transporter (DMT)-like permease
MVVGIGAPYMLVVSYGLALAPVGLFAVLTPGTMIVFSALLNAVWLKSRMPARERVGITAIVAGGCIAGFQSFLSAANSGTAVGLFVFGGLLWAIYTVSTKAFAIGALRATTIVSVVSALIYSPVYFAMKGLAILDAPARELLTQTVYQGILVSILALYLYSKSVSLLGPTIGASFAALVPVLAVIEASLLLGERPSAASLIGLVVVTVGMVLNLLKPRPRREPDKRHSSA